MGTNLKFIPINDLNLIPRYLVDQIKDKDFTTEHFYKMAPIITSNPLGVLGVFSDKESRVKGFMWATISPLSEDLNCHLLSVDKEYQQSTILKEAAGILKKIQNINKCGKIIFTTTRPKAFEKAGYKYNKHTMMEV